MMSSLICGEYQRLIIVLMYHYPARSILSKKQKKVLSSDPLFIDQEHYLVFVWFFSNLYLVRNFDNTAAKLSEKQNKIEASESDKMKKGKLRAQTKFKKKASHLDEIKKRSFPLRENKKGKLRTLTK